MDAKNELALLVIAVIVTIAGIFVLKDLFTASEQTKGLISIQKEELKDDEKDDEESLDQLVRDANSDFNRKGR